MRTEQSGPCSTSQAGSSSVRRGGDIVTASIPFPNEYAQGPKEPSTVPPPSYSVPTAILGILDAEGTTTIHVTRVDGTEEDAECKLSDSVYTIGGCAGASAQDAWKAYCASRPRTRRVAVVNVPAPRLVDVELNPGPTAPRPPTALIDLLQAIAERLVPTFKDKEVMLNEAEMRRIDGDFMSWPRRYATPSVVLLLPKDDQKLASISFIWSSGSNNFKRDRGYLFQVDSDKVHLFRSLNVDSPDDA